MIYHSILPVARTSLQQLFYFLIALAVPTGVWAQGAVDNDAALSQLILKNQINETITLDPTFSPGNTNYEAIAVNTSYVTVIPQVRDSDATFAISPSLDVIAGGDHQVVISGGGATIIEVTVTAEDRITTQTYTVEIISGRVTLSVSPSQIYSDGDVATVTATMSPAQIQQRVEVRVEAEAVAPATSVDFTLSQSSTLIFTQNATQSTGTVTIESVNNNSQTLEKTVRVTGTVYNNAIGIVVNPATLTIEDQKVYLTLNPATVAEHAGQTNVTVTATLEGSTTHSTPTTVTISVAGGQQLREPILRLCRISQ